MQPPAVQSLEQIIAEQSPAYQKQEQLLGQQRSGLGIKYDSQRSALGAEKTQGFNQINNQATGRGLSFSGIPLDEQATYLSTKYLPGMQNLASQQNQEDMSLQQALAQIDTQRRTRALDTRSQQQSSLEKYLADERDRQFRADQSRLDREAAARESAANRATRDTATGPKFTWKKNAAGGYDVYDAAGGKANVDLATAVASQGGGLTNLVSLLAGGSASDRRAAQSYMDARDPVSAYNALVKGTGAFYTGGGF